jgi:hypothetical protein
VREKGREEGVGRHWALNGAARLLQGCQQGLALFTVMAWLKRLTDEKDTVDDGHR